MKGKTAAADKSGGEDSGPGSSVGGVVDLGIFVKSVIHGGAASRDGRLKTNDQVSLYPRQFKMNLSINNSLTK